MIIETLGHASLLLRADDGAPVLLTDPWLIGSCYWRSWWLQSYPGDERLTELRDVAYCLITHEHPDHFHTASIRALGRSTTYLSPALLQGRIAPYLAGLGYTVSVVEPFVWKALRPDVHILSIPLLNSDSVLLIDTPHAIVINLNDSKPRRGQLDSLREQLDIVAPGKTRIVLSSYSPASIVNSFLRGETRVSLRQKASYVSAVSDCCATLRADYFMPFASQVIFERRDSAWANAFKVSFEDLEEHWRAVRTQLLRPYARLDCTTGTYSFLAVEDYLRDQSAIAAKVLAQEAKDHVATLSGVDIERLRTLLNRSRWLLAVLFPRGIGFEAASTVIHYSPWTGACREGARAGDIVIRVPPQALREAVEYGHFADLGTTMFTMVVLNSNIDPRRVYLFFLMMSLHDYGHATRWRDVLRWLRWALAIHRWRVPVVPSARA